MARDVRGTKGPLDDLSDGSMARMVALAVATSMSVGSCVVYLIPTVLAAMGFT